MPNRTLSKYSAKIKDVYIELKDYEFFHSPYDSKGKERFIGRNKVKEKIIAILKKTDIKSGSYLITGFRGMGKTSIIREAIELQNNEGGKPKSNILKNTFSKANLLFFKRFLGYTIGFGILLLLFRTESKGAGANPRSLITNIKMLIGYLWPVFVIHVLFMLPDYTKNKKNEFKTKWMSKTNNFIFYCCILFLSLFRSDWFSSIISGTIVTLYILFLFVNFSTLFGSGRITKALWQFYKLLSLVSLFIILGLGFYFFFDNPSGFREMIFCKEENCSWFKYLFSSSDFPNKEAQNFILEHGININLDTKKTGVFSNSIRVLFSLLLAYGVLSIFLFIVDFISQVCVYFQRQLSSETIKEEAKRYKKFEINLSLESLNEMDVLRRMTIYLEEYWRSNKLKLSTPLFDRKIYFFWRFLLSKINLSSTVDTSPSYESVLNKLSLLKSRMSGQVTSKQELNLNPNITTGISRGLTRIAMPLGKLSNKHEVVYPIANSKEAEDQLRIILNDIDKIRSKKEWGVRQFIFIIDELDKIEPHGNSNIEERESSNPSLETDVKTRDTSQYRRRQEAVASLLANLKGFLNVVRAKFFFIGGREMFDASLADISDRDSFYSSIFNDVLYLDSFFKDTTEVNRGLSKGGVTQMTEAYLCNVILNDKDSNHKNLKDIFGLLNFMIEKKYLGNTNIPRSEWSTHQTHQTELRIGKKGRDRDVNSNIPGYTYDELKKQAYKVIFTLQNYIIYLTYRSNGTPKKLTALTERLIVKGPSKDKIEPFLADNVVVLNDKSDKDLSERLFLKFGYNTQYEIGLTSDLYRPYLIANSRHLKSLGDKLLFSSSFIIDHIFKFHPFGFSWRNLELIPEVVLVNREPNLRKFIEEVMRFYSMTYVRNTVSGIFDYTFRSIVKRELIFLSKTSDLSSAAFNFTLDESLSTKRHYKKKAIEIRNNYKRHSPTNGDNQFIHSLSFVQTLLGDLHFYDKEYDEAIVYYTESIQALRLPNAVSNRYITRHQFLLWIRNQLKLGLSLEKIRALDSAFSLYKTLIIDIERYLKLLVEKDEKNSNPNLIRDTEDHRSIHLVSMPFVAFLAVAEKVRMDGITYSSLIRNRKEFIRTIIPDEQNGNGKIDIDDYRRNILQADYYNNVGSILFYKNCQFSDFFANKDVWLDVFDEIKGENHIANQQSTVYDKRTGREYDFHPSLASFNYYWNSLFFLVKYHRDRIIEVIKSHNESVEVDGEIIPLSQNHLALCAAYLLPKCVDMVNATRMYYMANVVSKIGDSILASLKTEDFEIPNEEFSISGIGVGKEVDRKDHIEGVNEFRELVGKSLYKVKTVLYIYKLAALLYKRAGHNSFYASHLIKILYIIKDLVQVGKPETTAESKEKTTQEKENQKEKKKEEKEEIEKKKEEIEKFLKITEKDIKAKKIEKIEKIAEAIFRATTWNNEVSNRPQILKYRDIFRIEEDSRDRELLYSNINNTSDNREAIILVEGIKMKLWKYDVDSFIEQFTMSKNIISAYGTMTNRYLRTLELKYRSERSSFILKYVLELGGLFEEKMPPLELKVSNEQIIKRIGTIIYGEKSQTKSNLKINDIVSFIIREALFCLRELIKMIKLYDPGYVIGYSFIAEAHNRMGDWCLAYHNYINLFEKQIACPIESQESVTQLRNKIVGEGQSNFVHEVEKVLGSDNIAYLESKNHYEAAIQYYYRVIQLHSEGKTYKDKLHGIYMLEDDYNDSIAHFWIAGERLRINTGNIKNKIVRLSTKIENSKMYQYSSYITDDYEEKKGDGEIYKTYLEFLGEKIRKII